MKKTLAILFALALSVCQTQAASDFFLKIPDIPGESEDASHKGEIEVLSYSWGMSNSGTAITTGGGGAGKVSMQDFHFVKYVDKSSPKLMLNCANGKHIPEVILFVRKPSQEREQVYLKYTLQDVIISSYSVGGSQGETRMTDQFAINFARILVDYIPTKPDGSPDVTVEFGWDLETNAEVIR